MGVFLGQTYSLNREEKGSVRKVNRGKICLTESAIEFIGRDLRMNIKYKVYALEDANLVIR